MLVIQGDNFMLVGTFQLLVLVEMVAGLVVLAWRPGGMVLRAPATAWFVPLLILRPFVFL
jgi:hypothetical protein